MYEIKIKCFTASVSLFNSHTSYIASCNMFIAKRANTEKFMLSTAPASLSIRDLVIELVKICDTDIVKLTLRDIYMYMKLATILFLFTLEHCVENVYFGLCQSTYMVSEKFEQFVIYLQFVTYL